MSMGEGIQSNKFYSINEKLLFSLWKATDLCTLTRVVFFSNNLRLPDTLTFKDVFYSFLGCCLVSLTVAL